MQQGQKDVKMVVAFNSHAALKMVMTNTAPVINEQAIFYNKAHAKLILEPGRVDNGRRETDRKW